MYFENPTVIWKVALLMKDISCDGSTWNRKVKGKIQPTLTVKEKELCFSENRCTVPVPSSCHWIAMTIKDLTGFVMEFATFWFSKWQKDQGNLKTAIKEVK